MNLNQIHTPPRRLHAGFTLIELVLVMTIITILVGSGIYLTKGQAESAKFTTAENTITALKTQLLLYEKDNKILPSSDQGLMALVKKPTTDPIPRRWTQLYEDDLEDPWDNTYRYEYRPKKDGRSKTKFDIWSAGPDGVDGNEDDIGNWSVKESSGGNKTY